MSNLTKKKKSRDARRKTVNSNIEKAKNLISTNAETVEIIAIRDTLIEKYNQVKQLDDEIFDLMIDGDNDNIDAEEESSTNFSTHFKHQINIINSHLASKEESVSVTSSRASSSSSSGVKLPKLSIKTFDGEPTNWQFFIDSFACAVDSNETLSDVQKLTYLKTLVSGKAASIIDGLSLSNTNYQIAMNLLKERYDNKQLQISSHMKTLLEISEIRDVSNVESLRKIYDVIETQIRSLEHLGIQSNMYGPMLVPIVMSKIPDDINLIISRQLQSEDCWEISAVLKILKTEITAREKVNLSSNVEDDLSPRMSASALVANSAGKDTQNQQKKCCVYCGKPHNSIDCRIVTDINRKKEIIRDKKLCFVCLRSGHRAKNCRSKIRCYKCERKHHTSICQPIERNDNPNEPQNAEPTTSAHVSNKSPSGVLLQTAKASVSNPSDSRNKENARILFDSGSQLSYITPKLKEKLKLKSNNDRKIAIHTFGNKVSQETLEQVTLSIHCNTGEVVYVTCYVKDICSPIINQPIEAVKSSYPHLSSLQLADSNLSNTCLPIDILIGSNYYWSLVNNQIVRGDSGPVAVNTKLGYILSGTVNDASMFNHSKMLLTHTMECHNEFLSKEQVLNTNFSKTWGEENNDSFAEPIVEKFDKQKFVDSITFDFKENRYVVPLPFKEEHSLLADNYSHCEKRLNSLEKKFVNNPQLFDAYNNIIKEQLDANVIEKVPIESSRPVGEIHYLPHRPVERPDKQSTKIRMVFDASAKTSGPSLNECLHQGPSLTEPLLSVLLRFRSNQYAFIADIEKSFLQILLDPEHRDYVRFLWYADPYNVTSENFQEAPLCSYRLCRLLFGLTSSPFSLSATVIKHMNTYQSLDPVFVSKVMKILHVDDLNGGANTIADAYSFYNKAKTRFAAASFNLRKFQSNSPELEARVSDEFSLSHLTDPITKVLGVNWDKNSDEFVFNLQDFVSSVQHPTKRELLSAIASIYDPLGFLNPFVLQLKELFQRACVSNIAWDQKLDDDLLHDWSSILYDLKGCHEIRVPRHYDCGDPFSDGPVELHGFCDASLKGYGCCIYIRYVDSHGDVKCSLVTSQSRISPISKPTIPKLELQAAVLLSKCANNVVEVLSSSYVIGDVHLYSDSTIALSWIHSPKPSTPYVRRRVDIISSLTSLFHWHHVSGVKNPSDILSRGCTFSVLSKTRDWFYGPDFLHSVVVDFDSLGRSSIFYDFVNFSGRDSCLEEASSNCLTVNTETVENNSLLDHLISKFNEYTKLIRVTAYVLRFVRNLKQKVQTLSKNVTTEEFQDAEMLHIKYAQSKMKKQKNYEQLKKELNLSEVDGIIRCKGRLKNAPIPYSTKYPILLPRNDEFSALVIKHAHVNVLHNGMKETVNELRKRFWIPKTRLFVKSIIHKCSLCKLFEGKPFAYPPSPDLPESRLSAEFPFTFVGLDYAGPIYVKNIYNGDDMYKCWIFLYTCASTRALYLDLVPDASATSCINALRRFISDRGAPKVIISDNGSQFKAEETQSFASNRNIKWKFNLAAAPWWGGMFERMVRSTKRCLKKLLLRSYLNFEELRTVLAEIQCTLNNRPLTFTYEEPGDVPLTPNHLLYGRTLNRDQTEPSSDVVDCVLPANSKRISDILNHFWSRWKNEYLVELRENHKQNNPKGYDTIQVDDIVIIQGENMKQRGMWKVGVITEIIPSRDGRIRGAKVKYRLNGKDIIISRPVNKLYPLEEPRCSSDLAEITFIDENDVRNLNVN